MTWTLPTVNVGIVCHVDPYGMRRGSRLPSRVRGLRVLAFSAVQPVLQWSNQLRATSNLAWRLLVRAS
jgi:hypothetical protein